MKSFVSLIACILYFPSVFGQTDVVVNIDFSSSEDQRFLIANNESYYTYITTDGLYKIKSKDNDATFRFDANVNVFENENYKLSGKIRATAAGYDDYFGIYIGKKDDPGHYMRFVISPKRKLALTEQKNGRTTDQIEWTASNDINSNGAWNEFTIERAHGELIASINGIEKYRGKDQFGNISEVGILVAGNATLETDYIKVEVYDRPINLVKGFDKTKAKERLGPNINSEYIESSPIISLDGNTMYLIRHGYNMHWLDDEGKGDYDSFWKTQKTNEGWGNLSVIREHSFFNTWHSRCGLDLSADGNSFIVSGIYKNDEYVKPGFSTITKSSSGVWLPPTEMKIKNLNKYDKGDQVYIKINKDGKTLLLDLCTKKNDTYFSELFVCFKTKNGGWTEPKNLGPTINKGGRSGTPVMAADGKTMYFSSNGLTGYGNMDVFVTKRLDDTWTNWSEPKNLGPKINSSGWDGYFVIPADGEYAYLISVGEDGNSNLYRVQLSEEAQPEPVELVQGHIYDSKTNLPLKAEITLRNLETNEEVGQAIGDPTTGYFEMVLPKGQEYALFAQLDGYYSVRENMNLRELKKYTKTSLDLHLSPIEIGQSIKLNNIFFEVSKPTILPKSLPELDELVRILKDNPDIRILIEGHTDDRGQAEQLWVLSQQRADKIKKYLVSKG